MTSANFLAFLKTGVTEVTGVTPAETKGCSVSPWGNTEVTRGNIQESQDKNVTPVTPIGNAGVTLKPAPHKAVTLVTLVTPENKDTKAVSLLRQAAKEIDRESDLAALIDWYRPDFATLATLPLESVTWLINDYFAHHHRPKAKQLAKWLVKCRDCQHFKRIEHPHLGHCKQGQRENIAGLWDDDPRACEAFNSETINHA